MPFLLYIALYANLLLKRLTARHGQAQQLMTTTQAPSDLWEGLCQSFLQEFRLKGYTLEAWTVRSLCIGYDKVHAVQVPLLTL